jgi:hypothetical protein
MTLPRLICLTVLLFFPPATAFSQSNAEKGYDIARRAAERDSGYGDYVVSGKMVLRDKGGRESERLFDLKVLERGDGDRTLLIFNWPGDIRDTALLTHSFENRDDNQWLYLPSFRRVKRISGSGRSGSFVGSEFAYEDMVIQDVDKFKYEWIADQACPTAPQLKCHIIDRMPRYDSGYSRQRVALDTDQLRVLMVQYFDRSGKNVKTLTAAGYRQYKGRYWRADIMRMANHQTGKSSDMIWSDYKFDVGLVEAQFSVNALQNVR